MGLVCRGVSVIVRVLNAAEWGCRIQQYHTALLLLMEIFANPNRREANRIWRCLDYVFEIPGHISKDQKGRWVMTEIRDRMGLYIASRKVMAPSSLLDRIGSQSSRSGSATSASPPAPVGKMAQSNMEASYGFPPSKGQTQVARGSEGFRPDQVPYQGSAGNQLSVPTTGPPVQGDKIDIDWVGCQPFSGI